jgi:hypothetical protein
MESNSKFERRKVRRSLVARDSVQILFAVQGIATDKFKFTYVQFSCLMGIEVWLPALDSN